MTTVIFGLLIKTLLASIFLDLKFRDTDELVFEIWPTVTDDLTFKTVI